MIAGQFWLVRIPYYPGHARKLGHFFGGTLGVAASDNYPRGMILRADFSDGVSGLRVRSGGNGAGVYDHDIGCAFGRSGVAALQQLHFKRGAIGLRGATSKLLNVKSRHDFEFTAREFCRPAQGGIAGGRATFYLLIPCTVTASA